MCPQPRYGGRPATAGAARRWRRSTPGLLGLGGAVTLVSSIGRLSTSTILIAGVVSVCVGVTWAVWPQDSADRRDVWLEWLRWLERRRQHRHRGA
jgi:hypothetical protein